MAFSQLNRQREEPAMKKKLLLFVLTAFGMLSVLLWLPVRLAHAQTVFQAAGPTAESIQATVDAFRAALGGDDNRNLGPQPSGHREINWDGGGSTDTAPLPPVTPFNVFLNTRGAQFTTPGTGLTQAPPMGGAQGGLATLFNNPDYADIFKTFSAPRLFTPVGNRLVNGAFFLPGSDGATPATVTGFGAVFTDVDSPGARVRHHSTFIDYFDTEGRMIFRGLVPASPGDGTFSFFGIVFDDARIARVRITVGDSRPGPDDIDVRDIVMMDDFLYGEPQAVP
jgi:hypothetical protein